MDLKVSNLSIEFDKKNIINDVSLAVKNGEFVGMIGPNGSGKSTLLRTIYRIIEPSTGTILLDGENLKKIKLTDSAKKMGVVGQFNTINFDFTVFEMVLMGRTPHKKSLENDNVHDYELATHALRQVGMENYARRSFSTLSGGEKQRILLARALAQEPELLILDEPTNHLDIKYQLQILSIVKSLGIGVLAALHDLSLAAMYCDKLYVLKAGKVITCGKPKEILTSKLIQDVYEIECDIKENPATGYLAITYYPTYRHA